jgi:hypothetical protein
MSIDRAPRPTSRKPRAARWAVPAILLALALATPLQALGAEPSRSDPVDTFAGQTRQAVSINLHRSSAMVKQYTNYWCVPAATQSMVNIVRGTSNRTYSTQSFMYKKTRQNNQYSYATLGNDPVGWAWAATYFSRGEATYAARAYSSRADAIAEIGAQGHARLGRARLQGRHAAGRSRLAARLRLLRERPAGQPDRSVVGQVHVRGHLQQQLHPVPRVAATGHLGGQVRGDQRLTHGRHRRASAGDG